MKIALVPLDDRPCCAQWPAMLGRLAGWEVLSPDRALLGSFLTPGDPPRILDWLRRTTCDARVVSMDMLLMGGLVASRSPATPPGPTVSEALQAVGPGGLANSVLMRVAPTATKDSDVSLTGRLHEYSGRRARGEATAAVEKSLPTGWLDQYLATRRRNHQVNVELLKAAADARLAFLVVGIDDSKTVGLNVLERQVLEPLLSSRSRICPGTDELAHLLLARLTGRSFSVHVTWSDPNASRATPLYEDRSFEALVAAQLGVIGGRVVEDDADIRLFAHVHPQGQREAAEQLGRGRPQKRLSAFVKSIRQAIDEGTTVAVADMAYANGGDLSLARMLEDEVPLLSLGSFAAWNTAGNTLGTALSAACLRHVGGHSLEKDTAHAEFMLNRWLDDVVYQSRVRQEARLTVLPVGVSAYALGDEWPAVEHGVARRMADEADKLFKRCFAGRRLGGRTVEGFSLHTTLPWPRLFEVELDLRVHLR